MRCTLLSICIRVYIYGFPRCCSFLSSVLPFFRKMFSWRALPAATLSLLLVLDLVETASAVTIFASRTTKSLAPLVVPPSQLCRSQIETEYFCILADLCLQLLRGRQRWSMVFVLPASRHTASNYEDLRFHSKQPASSGPQPRMSLM